VPIPLDFALHKSDMRHVKAIRLPREQPAGMTPMKPGARTTPFPADVRSAGFFHEFPIHAGC